LQDTKLWCDDKERDYFGKYVKEIWLLSYV